jgi:predicted nucleic acid-binding Zn finger protein
MKYVAIRPAVIFTNVNRLARLKCEEGVQRNFIYFLIFLRHYSKILKREENSVKSNIKRSRIIFVYITKGVNYVEKF